MKFIGNVEPLGPDRNPPLFKTFKEDNVFRKLNVKGLTLRGSHPWRWVPAKRDNPSEFRDSPRKVPGGMYSLSIERDVYGIKSLSGKGGLVCDRL